MDRAMHLRRMVRRRCDGRELQAMAAEAGLTPDAAGNFYGTTVVGGTHLFSNFFGGTIFKMTPTGQITVLYNFCSQPNCVDGSEPTPGVIRDEAGNLYGTTDLGGAFGTGTLFKVDTTGVETVLRSLAYSTDGGYPYAGLIVDTAGDLYGTTSGGGPASAGTVFKLVP